MKREDVKKILPEITGEQLDEIMKMHGDSVTEYKAGLDSLKNEIAAAKEKLGMYEGMDIEKIKADEFARGKASAEKELDEYRLSNEIDSALTKAGARNVKALRALLDTQSIRLEDGALTGLGEQLEQIKAENGFLFEEGSPKPKFTDGVTGGGSGITKDAFQKMGYSDRVKLYNESPEVYNELNN